MKQLFFFALLFTCTSLIAQKKRIGYVNGDSLLNTIPDYVAIQSSGAAGKGVQDTLAMMDYETEKKAREIDSLKDKDSPLIHALRNEQLKQLKQYRKDYGARNEGRTSDNGKLLLPYSQALLTAAENARLKNKCDTVLLSGTPATSEQAQLISLNNEAAGELTASKRLYAEPKRIGYINSDSLYKQMPGYAENRSASNNERAELERKLKAKDKEIAAKQNENDSLYGKRSPLMRDRGKAEEERLNKERAEMVTNGRKEIAHNDSVRNSANIAKMEAATRKLCVSDSCFYIYDKATAQQLFSGQNVIMVNMNEKMAKEIGVAGLPPFEEPPIDTTPPPPVPKSKAE